MAELTKVQQRVVNKIASGAALNYINGGGWRLMDGTKVHYRTVSSLSAKGLLVPAGKDLFGDSVTSYSLAKH
ncbi:hypothetical protein [Halomonas sp. MS1]|nr:hypothetical protein [Halomonas sp. MS1]UTD54958.1 hypothetical protein NF683_17695 [Halomonas sp. MS1]